MPAAGTEKKGPGLFRGAVHGSLDLVRKDGSAVQVTYDLGKIAAIGDGSITLKRRDGQTVTLSTDGTTAVREKQNVATLAELGVGDRAMFFSQGGHATLIRCIAKPKS